MIRIVASGCIGVQMPLEAQLRMVRDLGFREIDLLLVSGWSEIGTDELAASFGPVCGRIERALRASDVKPAAINAKFSVPLEDQGPASVQRRREADALVRLVRALGVDRISIQPTLSSDTALLQRGRDATVSEVMALHSIFGERGIRLSLEPHIMSAFCTNDALAAVRSRCEGFPITYDPSHLLYMGEAMASLDWMPRRATMAHLRDARPGQLFVPFGEGTLDADRSIRELVRSGYDGPIAIEYICDGSPDRDMQADLHRFAQHIKDTIAAASRERA